MCRVLVILFPYDISWTWISRCNIFSTSTCNPPVGNTNMHPNARVWKSHKTFSTVSYSPCPWPPKLICFSLVAWIKMIQGSREANPINPSWKIEERSQNYVKMVKTDRYSRNSTARVLLGCKRDASSASCCYSSGWQWKNPEFKLGRYSGGDKSDAAKAAFLCFQRGIHAPKTSQTFPTMFG